MTVKEARTPAVDGVRARATAAVALAAAGALHLVAAPGALGLDVRWFVVLLAAGGALVSAASRVHRGVSIGVRVLLVGVAVGLALGAAVAWIPEPAIIRLGAGAAEAVAAVALAAGLPPRWRRAVRIGLVTVAALAWLAWLAGLSG